MVRLIGWNISRNSTNARNTESGRGSRFLELAPIIPHAGQLRDSPQLWFRLTGLERHDWAAVAWKLRIHTIS